MQPSVPRGLVKDPSLCGDDKGDDDEKDDDDDDNDEDEVDDVDVSLLVVTTATDVEPPAEREVAAFK